MRNRLRFKVSAIAAVDDLVALFPDHVELMKFKLMVLAAEGQPHWATATLMRAIGELLKLFDGRGTLPCSVW